MFFLLSFTRSNVLYSPTLLSHFHKLQSVSLVSRIPNGIKNMHILASGPELQAVILGENWKKGRILKRIFKSSYKYCSFHKCRLMYFKCWLWSANPIPQKKKKKKKKKMHVWLPTKLSVCLFEQDCTYVQQVSCVVYYRRVNATLWWLTASNYLRPNFLVTSVTV
jgi:hypothetical protein